MTNGTARGAENGDSTLLANSSPLSDWKDSILKIVITSNPHKFT
jgi:hypothetical protein